MSTIETLSYGLGGLLSLGSSVVSGLFIQSLSVVQTDVRAHLYCFDDVAEAPEECKTVLNVCKGYFLTFSELFSADSSKKLCTDFTNMSSLKMYGPFSVTVLTGVLGCYLAYRSIMSIQNKGAASTTLKARVGNVAAFATLGSISFVSSVFGMNFQHTNTLLKEYAVCEINSSTSRSCESLRRIFYAQRLLQGGEFDAETLDYFKYSYLVAALSGVLALDYLHRAFSKCRKEQEK